MPDPLRIAFVSMHTSPADLPGSGDAGGMNVVEHHQALGLAQLGHRVDLITRRSDPGQPDLVELSDGVRLLHLPAGPPERLAKSLIDAHIEEFSAGLAALGGGYDVLHSHHWMSGVAALPVARAWGVPHVQSFHSVAALPGSALSEGEPPESPARVPGERLVATESDAVIAISAAEARTVVERCGADPDRVVIVPPGVDRSIFHPGSPPLVELVETHPSPTQPAGPPLVEPVETPAPLVELVETPAAPAQPAGPPLVELVESPAAPAQPAGPPLVELVETSAAPAQPAGPPLVELVETPPSAPSTNPHGYLLYAARLQPLKGPDLAIGALAEVPAELRPDLLIAGDVSADFAAYQADLYALVEAHGLSGAVHFIGPQPREKLAELMRGARIVLVPSHSETFGLIALEAESCGTPVIASAAGGLREAVVHGETGQLMDSRQPEDWGTAITRLLAKPQRLARMGVVAQIHARRFDWGWTARLLELHYRALR
ncbi:glycosyltransferase [Micropruina sp.]|uniref:glycosyltransferase n=1 Tax=Micropruina sp. TaxID=2737536 RepID=UPI002607F4D5|nr:glycosyltransferase [Micropruina sp.]